MNPYHEEWRRRRQWWHFLFLHNHPILRAWTVLMAVIDSHLFSAWPSIRWIELNFLLHWSKFVGVLLILKRNLLAPLVPPPNLNAFSLIDNLWARNNKFDFISRTVILHPPTPPTRKRKSTGDLWPTWRQHRLGDGRRGNGKREINK